MKEFIMCLSILFLTNVSNECQLKAQTKKNVLLLMADDFNYWTGKGGYYPHAKTPNLDSLANKGVFFSNAHCSQPLCNPSRNAMWSGFRTTTTQITGNSTFTRDIKGFENIVTMNQYFKENGYYVYGGGKLYHPGNMSSHPYRSDNEHFSDVYPGGSGCQGGSLYRHFLSSKTNYGWSANPDSMTIENCKDYALAEHFADKIKNYSSSSQKDQPFFFACGFFRPHAAWHSPKYFWDLFNRDSLTIPPGYHPQDEPGNHVHQEIVQDTLWMKAIHGYLASCALADYNVGVVMDALKHSPYKDNTIVLFMGDHGWHLGEKGHWGKFSVWEEANKTTFIIYDPSAKANGSECIKPVSLQDVYPTLMDIAGVPQKTDIEGNSLAQLLVNSNDPSWKHPIITRDGSDELIIRTEKWRYIDDGDNKLFNMIEDPYQWNNLYGKSAYNKVVDSLTHLRDSIIQIGTDLKNKLLDGYTFTPSILSIPGTIEAEDYDEGTNGHTYHDLSPGNSGNQYRTGDDTDIEITNDAKGAFHISDIENGEWLEYAITNYKAGTYDFKFRISNNNISSVLRKIKVSINNVPKGEVIVTATKANEWKDVILPNVKIEENQHLSIKLEFMVGGFKLNSFQALKKVVSTPFVIYNDGSKSIIKNTIVSRNESLKLDLLESGILVKIDILNIQGKKLKEEFLIGELMVDFNLNNELQPGTYFMRFNDGIRIKTEKFIVK